MLQDTLAPVFSEWGALSGFNDCFSPPMAFRSPAPWDSSSPLIAVKLLWNWKKRLDARTAVRSMQPQARKAPESVFAIIGVFVLLICPRCWACS